MKDKERAPARPCQYARVDALGKQTDPWRIVAWYCMDCGRVFSTKEDAERCPKCSKWACEDCGEPCTPYQWFCIGCLQKRRLQRDRQRLAEASTVISWREYPSHQGVFWEDDYYESLMDLADHCDYNELKFPERVWASTPEPFRIDVEDVLEHAFETWAEGAPDVGRCWEGEKELREAVAAFNDRNKDLVLFVETRTVAVDLAGYLE